jgi:hypothetical protein
VLIFSQNFFPSARRLLGEDLLSMLTRQDRTPPEDAELFAKKIGSASDRDQFGAYSKSKKSTGLCKARRLDRGIWKHRD